MENKFNIGIEPFSGFNNASPFGGVGSQPMGFGPNPRPGTEQPLPNKPEEEPSKEEGEPGKKKKKKNMYEITCRDC